jgi:hypothetical protein
MNNEELQSLLLFLYLLGVVILVIAAYLENHKKQWKSDVNIVWLVCWFWPLIVPLLLWDGFESWYYRRWRSS